MHSPPPELTDAGRRGGQPLHARCHRNALSLKHRLIITDARPFSLSLPPRPPSLHPPWAIPLGNQSCYYNPLSPFLTAFSSLPRSLSLRCLSLALTALSRRRARCPRFSFCLTCLRVAVACVMTEMVGTRGGRKLDGAAGPFVLRATFSRSNYRRTASCMTSWVCPKLRRGYDACNLAERRAQSFYFDSSGRTFTRMKLVCYSRY